MKYYPVTRHRNILTQDYISDQVKNGLPGYATFEEADMALDQMDTDDSDYEVCICLYGKWFATRDGKTVISRAIE